VALNASVSSPWHPEPLPDVDQDETREWLESLDTVINVPAAPGPGTDAQAARAGARAGRRRRPCAAPTTINTIPPEQEPWFPGDEYVERRIRAYIRWNAAIMVSGRNRPGMGVGGHIAPMPARPACTKVGFNHFFRGKDHGESGDQVFFQGHAPRHLARAFWRAGSASATWTASGRSLSAPAAACRAPDRGCCRTSGSNPTVSMGLGRCTRSTRPGSTGTC